MAMFYFSIITQNKFWVVMCMRVISLGMERRQVREVRSSVKLAISILLQLLKKYSTSPAKECVNFKRLAGTGRVIAN